MAVGLFTLNSESLGVLDTDVLGGLGTGYVVGSSSSNGSSTGRVGFFGSVVGSDFATGQVVGFRGAFGIVSGSVESSASASGSPDANGLVVSSVSSAGSVSGSPSIFGFLNSSSTSSGSVIGQVPSPAVVISSSWIVPSPQVRPFGFVWGVAITTGSVDGTVFSQEDEDIELLSLLGIL